MNSVKRAFEQPRLILPGALLAAFVLLQLALFLNANHGSAGEVAAFTANEMIMGKPGAFLVMMRCLLLLGVYSALIAALGEGSLFFDRSDIDFLFPAPLPHHTVLLYRMVGRYLTLLFPAAYFPITFAGGYLNGGNLRLIDFLPGILGSWLFLITITNIVQVFVLRSAADAERDARTEVLRRRLQQGLIAALVIGGAIFFFAGSSVSHFFHMVRVLNGSDGWGRSTPDAWAADLFHVLFDGFHREDTGRLLRLLCFCALSFAWLFGRERDFYETAMEMSVKRARVNTAIQSGDAGTVLAQMAKEGRLARGRSLPDFGGGARAILWKDLVAATRIPVRSWLQLLIPAAFPAVLGGLFGRESGFNVLGWTLLYSMQMPGIFLLTLRDVLRRADISKSLPISPLKLLAAELILPLGQLTLVGWLSLGMVGVAGLWRGPLLVVAAVVLPSLAALLFLVQAVFVLIYPNPNDPAQHAVSGVISLGVSLLAVLPGLAVAIPMYLLGTSPWVLALSVSAINIGIALIALLVAARLWVQFDPTD